VNAFSRLKKPDERFLELYEYAVKLEENLTTIDKFSGRLHAHEHELMTEFNLLANSALQLKQADPGVDKVVDAFVVALYGHVESLEAKLQCEDEYYFTLLDEYLVYIRHAKDVLRVRDQKQIDFEELTELLNQQITERDRIRQQKDTGSGITGYLYEKYEGIKGVDHERARVERLAKIESKIKELDQAVKESSDITHLFSKEVVREFGLFRSAKVHDFKTYLGHYAQGQVDHYQLSAKKWDQLITQLQDIDLE
jgi:sorting nexin-4